MSLSLGMTPIKEVKADLQFVVSVAFSQPCEPRMPGEGRMSPAVQCRVFVLGCCSCQWLWGCGAMCVCCGDRGGTEWIVHNHDFKAVMIQRESLPRVKLKCALCASAQHRNMSARNFVEKGGFFWMISDIWNKAVFSHVMEGRGCYSAELCKPKGAAIGWWT